MFQKVQRVTTGVITGVKKKEMIKLSFWLLKLVGKL